MTNYHTPDLTGADPAYYEGNLLRRIIKPSQVIELDSPVFDNNFLELFKTGAVLTPLIRDVDYKIDPNTNIDYDMMSRMRTIDSSFEAVLIKSITMMVGYSSDFTILIRCNRLFPNIVTYASIEEGPELEVTPALVSAMADEINFLKNVIVKEISNFSSQSLQNNILIEDPLGAIAANNIIGENHAVNTLSGTKLIKPIYGDFFKDSMTIINISTSEALVKDIDYRCVNLNLVKTNLSDNQSGVYKYIELLINIVGNISLDYHAYGGEATEENVRALDQQLKLVYDYLNKMEILTPNSIQTHPELIRINNKINGMEANMRMLLNRGIPSYGDVTHGIAVKKMITSMDDNLHWWSIATLFKVAGSDDIINADTATFKFQSLNTDLQFECKISFNMNNVDNPFSVKVINPNIHHNTFSDVMPSMRIIYKKEAEIYSGIVLQIGMKLKNILNETIAIEDISGKESGWILSTPSSIAATPEDNTVTLPNGSIYTEGEATSFSIETILPMEYNILGESPFNLFNGVNTINVDPSFTSINLPMIKEVTLILNQLDIPGTLYNIVIPVTKSNKLVGSANCCINLTTLNFAIDHEIGGNVKISMLKPEVSDPTITVTLSKYIVG